MTHFYEEKPVIVYQAYHQDLENFTCDGETRQKMTRYYSECFGNAVPGSHLQPGIWTY